MSVIEIPATCTCGSIGRTDLRQCPDHFHIYNGDRRLTSVGSIIRRFFPLDPSIPVSVLENARERGEEVDKLFAAYIRGELRKVPAGTREDSKELFFKLQNWHDRQNFSNVETQIVLGDSDYGGVLDLRLDSVPVELKATYNLEHTHRLQAAGYANLCGRPGKLLHVTERFKEPKLIDLDDQDYRDFDTLLAAWRMLQRRGVKTA